MIKAYIIILLAVLLLVFLLYKEFTRRRKAHLYLRILASVVAVVSLCLLAYPFSDKTQTSSHSIAIITPGFIKDSVADFLQQNKNSVLYSTKSAESINGKNALPITNMQAFAEQHVSDTLHVFGNGFNDETLLQLQPNPIIFHASTVLSAVTHIYWKQNIMADEELLLQGNYVNNRQQPVKIILQAFGQNKDSVSVAAHQQQTFQLQTFPLHTGNAVYALITLAGKDTLAIEPIPVKVQATVPLQLLMLSASPDFDNTYLKNQLAQESYKVTINTTVSTNKINSQSINMPAQTAGNTITSIYLQKFDVLVTDQETMEKMNAAQLATIKTAIADKGLGLIIKLENEKAQQKFYTSYFPVKALQKDKSSILTLHAADSNRFKINMPEQLAIVHTNGTQTILQDAASNSYASLVLYGSGKIMATSFGNTYSIALAGDVAAYRQLWTLLLNKVARKGNSNNSWNTQPFISFVNQPVQVQTENSNAIVSTAVAEDALVYFKQDALLPFIWKATYWPTHAGWQQLPQTDTAAANWYAYKNTDWQQLISYQQNEATRQYAALHPVNAAAVASSAYATKHNWQLWLFILFMATCIFLWVEQKTG